MTQARVTSGVCFFSAIAVFLFSVAMASEQAGKPKTILKDGFEAAGFENWDRDGPIKPTRIRITADGVNVHSGKRAVEFVAPIGKGSGGKLVKWFMPGFEKVYARWYCKFSTDFDQGNHMHFVHLLACRVDNKWSAFGKAGIRPKGDDFFTTGLEPWRNWKRYPPPGALQFYTYYPDMRGDRKSGKFWGNFFAPAKPFLLKRNQWYCMEMMVKLNDPEMRNGEQAFWVDGRKIGHFRRLRLRTSKRIRLNCFWLLLYVHDSKKLNKVWFDDVVISTEYIGPRKDSRLQAEKGSRSP